VDEDDNRSSSPILSLSSYHTKKSPLETKPLETGEKCVNQGVNLEKADCYRDSDTQATSKETQCSHAVVSEYQFVIYNVELLYE
jgi:hypothetical protein